MGQRANDSSLTCHRKRPPLSTYNQRPDYLLTRGEPLGRQTLDKLELAQKSTELRGADSQKRTCLGKGSSSAVEITAAEVRPSWILNPRVSGVGAGLKLFADWLPLEAAWTCVFGWCWRRQGVMAKIDFCFFFSFLMFLLKPFLKKFKYN